MRIISGKARGTKLKTLEGLNTRPTLDRVKESLFSIIQEYIEDAKVLDLFSGSGALALECLSRGASTAILCDNTKEAIEIIKQNVNSTHFNEQTQIMYCDYKKCIEKVRNNKFDLIFLDPPYETEFALEAVKLIKQNELLNKNGIIIFETDRKEEYIKKITEYMEIKDLRKYGRVTLVFLSRKEKK